MKFQNTNEAAALSFSICGTDYSVEAGGEVDIAASHVPYVYARGLQLERSLPKPKAADPAPKKSTPKTEVKNAPAGGKTTDSTPPGISFGV